MNVGDIVTGVRNSPYTETTELALMRVVATMSDMADVLILGHVNQRGAIGNTHRVEQRWLRRVE